MEDQSPQPPPAFDGLLLSYAPPARRSMRRLLVFPFGLLTTAIALIGVYVFSRWQHSYAMGWHYLYVIPYGALIVGVVAGSGYFFSGYFAGLRVRKHIFWLIVIIQILAFFGAEYLEFLSLGPMYEVATRKRVGFARYFHLVTTSMRWVGDSEPLGLNGYWVRGLELGGFLIGGVAWLAFLGGSNYCDLCSRYREKRLLALIPASAPYPKELDEQSKAAFETRSVVLMERAEERLAQLDQLAADGNQAEFMTRIEHGREEGKGAAKLPTRIRIEMSYCPNCHAGELVQFVQMGQEISRRSVPLPSIELDRAFVAGVVRGKRGAQTVE
jgi:hypothetical protein